MIVIPEGLPLTVTLSLAYSVVKMTKENVLVRKLSSCETMGSVNFICTDKIGTLSCNGMQVIKFWNSDFV